MKDSLLTVATIVSWAGMVAILIIRHSHPGGPWAVAMIVLAVVAVTAATRLFWTADVWKDS